MAVSIVKVPSQEAQGMDFLAFSFNGKHSWDDFHIYRTSDGDRYNENLTPTLTDKTAEVPGGDGMYYFGTTHKQRDFNISFAFDSLNEVQLKELKKWLNGKEMGDLWFQEAPYKVWTAKPAGNSSIKYIPFDDENGQRVYKGEGTVQFVAYWPYAHTPDFVAYDVFDLKAGEEFSFGRVVNKLYFKLDGDTTGKTFSIKQGSDFVPLLENSGTGIYYVNSNKNFSAINCEDSNAVIKISCADTESGEMEPLYYYIDGKDLNAYQPFKNRFQWEGTSGLVADGSKCQGENPGDVPTPFILDMGQGAEVADGDWYEVGEVKLYIDEDAKSLVWDSKTGIVQGLRRPFKDGEIVLIKTHGNSVGTIPVGGLTENQINTDGGTLAYHYWYY